MADDSKQSGRGYLGRLFSRTNAAISFVASIIGLSVLWNATTRKWVSARMEWIIGPGSAYVIGSLIILCLILATLVWISRQRLRTATSMIQPGQEALEQLRDWQARMLVQQPARQETGETDNALLAELMTDLPTESIRFMKNFDFANSFNWEEIEPFSSFRHRWKDARHEFLDEVIEGKKRSLVERTSELADAIALNTSIQWHGRHAVAEALKLDTPHGYREHAKEIKELNDKADAFVEAHEDFIRTARRRLAT